MSDFLEVRMAIAILRATADAMGPAPKEIEIRRYNARE